MAPPTMPDAQVNTFIGIGMNPPSTRKPNTAHGDCAIFACSVAMPAFTLSSMPSASSAGRTASNA